jgi:dienelactone hydrolase
MRRNTIPIMVLALLLSGSACSDDDATTDGAVVADSGLETAPDGQTSDGSREAAPSDLLGEGATHFTLTVTQGFGGGSYCPGQRVHLFADIDPRTQIVRSWTGAQPGELEDSAEWHVVLTMPARDVTLKPEIVNKSVTLQSDTVAVGAAPNARNKTYLFHVPANPKGVIGFFHGTSGSRAMIEGTEAFNVALRAIDAGYAVFATDAEEVDSGDNGPFGNSDGFERWNSTTPTASNVDLLNVKGVLGALVSKHGLPAQSPIYAIGMSNGGAFSVTLGAVFGQDAALKGRIKAVASYCASGSTPVAKATTTPTIWLMCENDSNTQVSNAKAKTNHDALIANKVASAFAEHPPSPLYDQRFTRVAGIDAVTSKALTDDLRAAGLIDGATSLLNKTYAELQLEVPKLASFKGLSPKQKGEVGSQLKVLIADHKFHADWAARTLTFFEAQ